MSSATDRVPGWILDGRADLCPEMLSWLMSLALEFSSPSQLIDFACLSRSTLSEAQRLLRMSCIKNSPSSASRVSRPTVVTMTHLTHSSSPGSETAPMPSACLDLIRAVTCDSESECRNRPLQRMKLDRPERRARASASYWRVRRGGGLLTKNTSSFELVFVSHFFFSS